MLLKWDELPEFMQCDEVREYYDILAKKKFALSLKRVFDVILASVLLILFAIPMLIITVMIKLDSRGTVFYRQERVTTYGKKFRIHKFRTMINNADELGTAITVNSDPRVTKIGFKLRKFRIDEVPQLIDILEGNMSFVGTRPEVTQYFEKYTNEMYATLLLPAGITSEASIKYKNEADQLKESINADKVYLEKILPEKMHYNLESIKRFSLLRDMNIMFKTVCCVFRKE